MQSVRSGHFPKSTCTQAPDNRRLSTGEALSQLEMRGRGCRQVSVKSADEAKRDAKRVMWK